MCALLPAASPVWSLLLTKEAMAGGMVSLRLLCRAVAGLAALLLVLVLGHQVRSRLAWLVGLHAATAFTVKLHMKAIAGT